MTDVLVVDDEAIVAEDLRLSLESFGYHVPATADTADEAVSKALALRPDVVVMDIRLKGEKDGIEAAQRIRAALGIPIIFVTAYGDDATLSRVEVTAPAGYILKPFNARDLHNAIELGLYRDRMEKQLLAAMEALRKANAELGSEREFRDVLIAVVAHDLRGPLSTVQMSAEQIARLVPQDKVAQLCIRIRRNVGRADRLVQDLLDAQRLRAGRPVEVELTRTDLAAIAQEVRDELVSTFGDRFPLEVAGAVRGNWNAGLLWRCLWNLATNAVKYGDRNTPIELAVRATPQLAVLTVHNAGEPIAPELQERLFKPFSRGLDSATSAQGWGLGLAVVAACAQAHRGAVKVDSAPGRGTTFSLVIPYHPEAERGLTIEVTGAIPH